jgi:hypothetical protein
MATVQDIIDAAYATSSKNRVGSAASELGELLPVVRRSVQSLFADAVTHNRALFAQRRTVAWDSALGGWRLPSGIESVIRLERVSGTPVSEVPFDDRRADRARPSVYLLGQTFYPAGNAGDPSNEPLVLFCSMMPAPMPSLESQIDPLLPEHLLRVPILEVAIYLAVKDGDRESEIAAFTAERDREYARYVEYLRHATTTLGRRQGHTGQVSTQSTQPTP